MNRYMGSGALLVALIMGGRELRADSCCCEPFQESFDKRLHPVGGWAPYGGGLLRWWPAHCFPCGGAPDDYCRKPLPPVCWPAYPSYYIWGPPEICSPQSKALGDCTRPH